MTTDPFTILDDSNTARVTMNNPFAGQQECVLTLNTPQAITHAVWNFAYRTGCEPREVQTSIIYPAE